MPPEEQNRRKNRRTYAVLLLAFLLLLLALVILLWLFLSALPPGGLFRLRERLLGVPGLALPGRVTPEMAAQRRAGPLGTSGRKRKYGLKIPITRPPGELAATNLEEGAEIRGVPFEPGLPVFFEEECRDYGGPFDFHARGAGFDVFLRPGELCLKLRRPEIEVQQGQTLIYTPRGYSYNACELDREVTICMQMLGAAAGAGRWEREDGGAVTNGCDQDRRLIRWHSSFPLDDSVPTNGAPRTDTAAARDPVWQREEQVGKRNFYVGTEPSLWFADLPAFASVVYRDVYPGVDLHCYAAENRLDYVFVVWPGGNPEDIQFTFDTPEVIELDMHGNLVIHLECGRIIQRPPIIYQVINGVPTPIRGDYAIFDRAVRFMMQEYAGEPPAPRAPALHYLSYLGGKGTDCAYAMAVDEAGYAYVAGETVSPPSPEAGAVGTAGAGSVDVFVTKYRLSDAQPIYTTFLGGQAEDRAFAVAVDRDGNAYVGGETLSADFPVTNAPAALQPGTFWDAFLVKLDPAGRLLTSLRFGGSGDERCYGLAVDASNRVYAAGETSSRDFYATHAISPRQGGGKVDAFVGRFAADLLALDYITTVGGAAENSAFAVAVDDLGCAYVAGETSSRDFPTVTAFQPTFQGGVWDGFVMRLKPRGDGYLYASFLGGSSDDRAFALAVDSARNVYAAGETASADLPSLQALQRHHAGGRWDAFAVKLAADRFSPLYATFLGGDAEDRGFAVVPDAAGHAHVAGCTFSTNLPVVNALQRSHGTNQWDGFCAKLDPAGDGFVYATYLGGGGNDLVYAAALDGSRTVHLAGQTASTNLATVRPLQAEYGGGEFDALAAGIRPEFRLGPELRLVSAGGQPDGPRYDFFMSEFEITNEEFVRFLNDAEGNPRNARGTNLFFDADGDVWFNAAMEPERDEVFDLDDSRIAYAAHLPVGHRYSVTPRLPRAGGSYSNHPVVGVSWYGAVKYCNWLTLDTGRGPDQLCYREGTNALDWAPATCAASNWVHGLMTDDERRAWLRFKGYRLPMDNCAGVQSMTNAYLQVSNADLIRFLNSAEGSTNTVRGAGMFFDAAGNVWFNPLMRAGRDEMFSVHASRIVYDPQPPPGQRYRLTLAVPPEGGSYSNYPAGGVSWIGAMKYANWLTYEHGYGVISRRYREGTNETDWAPVSCSETNWIRCDFTEEDRVRWARMKGYGLPLDLCPLPPAWLDARLSAAPGTGSWANAYNEFYKAAAWNGKSNVAYGFGRERLTPQDANYLDSGLLAWHDTTPVGFYDGSTHDGSYPTRTNENRYGIFDLSGNATEWLTCPGQLHSVRDRACYGGSWLFPLTRTHERQYVHPHFTDRFRGFRVVTTATELDMFMIRIPYRICLCGYGTGPGCAEVRKGKASVTQGGARRKEIAEEVVPEVEKGKPLVVEREDRLGPGGVVIKEKVVPEVLGEVEVPEESPSGL